MQGIPSHHCKQEVPCTDVGTDEFAFMWPVSMSTYELVSQISQTSVACNKLHHMVMEMLTHYVSLGTNCLVWNP